MNRYLKTSLVLGGICAVAAIILALLNSITAPYIEAYEIGKVQNALKEVACGYSFNEKIDVEDNTSVKYMYKLTEGSTVKGYILGLTGKGYGGDISMVASYDANGVVLAVEIVSDSETPGLGKRYGNSENRQMFIGTGSESNPIPTNKSSLSSDYNAMVSGASLTFNGLAKAISSGSDFVKSL